MASVPMIQKDSIVDQLEQVHQRIAQRASASTLRPRTS